MKRLMVALGGLPGGTRFGWPASGIRPVAHVGRIGRVNMEVCVAGFKAEKIWATGRWVFGHRGDIVFWHGTQIVLLYITHTYIREQNVSF